MHFLTFNWNLCQPRYPRIVFEWLLLDSIWFCNLIEYSKLKTQNSNIFNLSQQDLSIKICLSPNIFLFWSVLLKLLTYFSEVFFKTFDIPMNLLPLNYVVDRPFIWWRFECQWQQSVGIWGCQWSPPICGALPPWKDPWKGSDWPGENGHTLCPWQKSGHKNHQ